VEPDGEGKLDFDMRTWHDPRKETRIPYFDCSNDVIQDIPKRSSDQQDFISFWAGRVCDVNETLFSFESIF
jgi:hypothetical protein